MTSHHLAPVHLEISRYHFVLKSSPEYIIVLSALIPDSTRHHVQLRSIDAAPQLSTLFQSANDQALRHIGRKHQQLSQRLPGTQRKVRRTLLRLRLLLLQLPFEKRFIVHQTHLIILFLIKLMNLGRQHSGKPHHSLSTPGMGYHHIVQMRRIIHLVVQKTHLGQACTDIDNHGCQQHVPLTRTSRHPYPFGQQGRQMLKHLVGEIRCTPPKSFTFSEQDILQILFFLLLGHPIEWTLDLWTQISRHSVRPPGRNILITRR